MPRSRCRKSTRSLGLLIVTYACCDANRKKENVLTRKSLNWARHNERWKPYR